MFESYIRSRKPRLRAVGIRCADHATPSIRKKLALTSPTSGGRSVSIVRLRTKSHGVFFGGGEVLYPYIFSSFPPCLQHVPSIPLFLRHVHDSGCSCTCSHFGRTIRGMISKLCPHFCFHSKYLAHTFLILMIRGAHIYN
jgi:hypothetical protein